MNPKYLIFNSWNNQISVDSSLEMAIDSYEDEYDTNFQEEVKGDSVKVYEIGNEVKVSFEMKVVHVPKVEPAKKVAPAKKTPRKIN